jgi:putative SOS response-associated peptidase YedK
MAGLYQRYAAFPPIADIPPKPLTGYAPAMCNRYRVSAKQMELAERYGFDIDKLMPEPDPLPPPELFPKKPGWIVRKQDGALSLDVMQWGIPRHMRGKSGKPITS